MKEEAEAGLKRSFVSVYLIGREIDKQPIRSAVSDAMFVASLLCVVGWAQQSYYTNQF